jgi:hypothetical protein
VIDMQRKLLTATTSLFILAFLGMTVNAQQGITTTPAQPGARGGD